MRNKLKNAPSENCGTTFENLLTALNVPFTTSKASTIVDQPDYPRISSIVDSLNHYNIDNAVVKITTEHLQEIPLPAIAHFHKNSGHFVVLQKVTKDNIEYVDSRDGLINETIQDFAKKWSGVALLVEKSGKSSEPDYRSNRKQELVENFSQYLVAGLSCLLVAGSLSFLNSTQSTLFLLKSVGVVISLLLLQKQFGISSSLAESFCKTGTKKGCDSVIQSKVSKLFGIFFLSELSTLYFVGTTLAFIISAINSIDVSSYIFVLSAITVPVAVVSIYYQAFVIKQWCSLCLMVVAVLWIEFIVNLFSSPALYFTLPAFWIVVIAFSIPLISWFSLRKYFIESFKVKRIERRLLHFTKNEKLFQKMLELAPYKEVPLFTYELNSQKAPAPITITLISNPNCSPCARAHVIVNELVEQFEGQVTILNRFSLSLKDKESTAKQMIFHLFSMLIAGRYDQAKNALSDWYKEGHQNLAKWKKKFEVSTSDSMAIEGLVEKHIEWCLKASIQKTPTILINGRELPEGFRVEDLKYQIRKMVEKITEPEPVF